jgi:phosphoribosylaminoimidazolecarboxamide formyltransferase/IMP cyclohydrolase
MNQMEPITVRRALISVSDKTGLVEFASGLRSAGVEIFSTGGTGRHLEQHGVDVHEISQYTQFPEMMAGRVKTLHPKIFAGLLCRRQVADDQQAVADHGILLFDLVVVNLYPFAETVARRDVTLADAIEQIDIGGPSLVRAAAKNSEFVAICCRPDQYQELLAEIQSTAGTSLETRRRLMAMAFEHTADYDIGIAEYLSRTTNQARFPNAMYLSLKKKADLRYGENAHLEAALYSLGQRNQAHLLNARQLHGRQLSFNNLLDAEASLNIVRSLDRPACSVIKHGNPCGAAKADNLRTACEKGFAGDPVSAFGSVIGFNQTVDADTADFLASDEKFVEVIVAPDFADGALKVLTTRPKWKSNVRLLAVGKLEELPPIWEFRHLTGGMLVQDADLATDDDSVWKVVTERGLDDAMLAELRFAWHTVRFVKSNAITLCVDESLVGVGAGQMSRVDAVQIAIQKAGPRGVGSVLASDAFFPFPDSIDLAAAAGVRAIIQPGGSVRDADVIEACNRHGLGMIFTGRRHFRH